MGAQVEVKDPISMDQLFTILSTMFALVDVDQSMKLEQSEISTVPSVLSKTAETYGNLEVEDGQVEAILGMVAKDKDGSITKKAWDETLEVLKENPALMYGASPADSSSTAEKATTAMVFSTTAFVLLSK